LDPGFLETRAFPVLGSRVVYFQDTQDILRVWVPAGKRIEPCAENDILVNAPLDGTMEFVFSIPAARPELLPDGSTLPSVPAQKASSSQACVTVESMVSSPFLSSSTNTSGAVPWTVTVALPGSPVRRNFPETGFGSVLVG